jgi:hypothetical protein
MKLHGEPFMVASVKISQDQWTAGDFKQYVRMFSHADDT